jgi:hypothetical protein
MPIRTVFFFGNGNVAVCDEHGDQMPDYQGPLRDVREQILRDAPPTARFHHWLFPEILGKGEFEELTGPPEDWEPGG